MNESPSNSPAKPAAEIRTRKKERPLSTFGAVFFWILVVAVPVMAIFIEPSFRMDLDFLNPTPHVGYVIMLLLVPTCFGICAYYTPNREELGGSTWARAAIVLNAYALTLSFIYGLLYIPVYFMAIIVMFFFPLALLAFAPLFCMIGGLIQQVWLQTTAGQKGIPAGVRFRCFLIGTALAMTILGTFEVPSMVGEHAMALASSEDSAERERGLGLLETWGGEDLVLDGCYGRGPRLTRFIPYNPLYVDRIGMDACRKVYFRLTGRPFNSVPPPPTRLGATWRGRWQDEWNTIDETGGEAVAGRIRGLGLLASIMDVRIENAPSRAGPGLAYIEWTLEFYNRSSVANREVRTQILLPGDGVASRPTLWIEGEEREAAFGGRGRVRQAYQSAAVVTRRDPALLTTSGPDRVLLQCFPVPRDGSLKVKVGISAPLVLRGDPAHLRLPCFEERNFSIQSEFRHNLWVESDSILQMHASLTLVGGSESRSPTRIQGKLSEPDLLDPAVATLALPMPVLKESLSFEGTLGSTRAIMEWRRREPVMDPDPVCLVVDGSAAVASAGIDWQKLCSALPRGLPLNALFAGHTLERWNETCIPLDREAVKGLADWLETRPFEGGCDSIPALEAAWDLLAVRSPRTIFWIHRPMPVSLSSTMPFSTRLGRP